MVTLQDIGHHFMKPVKELTDWKFPLSQILEEYYTLMNEPCSINFGEAAIVVQNSTKVYVRRVDCLTDETSCLNKTFIDQTEKTADGSKPGRKNKSKVYIDLSDFKPLKPEEEIGKNINIRNRGEQKQIKLISRRFTQLENDTAKLSDDILDINREIIGKKHDFRCNQQLNINGVLVNECTPKDFNCNIPKQRLSTDTEFERTRSSGYQSCFSQCDDNSNFEENNEDNFDMCEGNELNKDALADSDYISIGSPTEFKSATVENTTIQKNDISTSEIQNVLSNSSINNAANTENTDVIRNCENTTSNPEMQQPVIENERLSNNQTDTNNLEKNKVTEKNKSLKEVTPDSNNLIKEANSKSRRSERVKNRIFKVDDTMNAHNTKFETFKLPCRISTTTKKRKSISKGKKRESLMKCLLNEKKSPQKSDSPCSSHKQSMTSSKEEEIKKFEKEFNNCLKNKEGFDDFRLQAVETITMNSVDYQPYETPRSTVNDLVFDDSNLLTDDSISNNITSDTPPYSPVDIDIESSSLCDEPMEVNSQTSTTDYDRIVADRMKEIFQETNVQTEMELSVAKWHETLQPKLAEAEQRPAFNLHDYTKEIVENLKATKEQRLKFDDVVQSKPPFEVARYFLATLQLANTYNVELNHENDCDVELILRNRENPKD